MRRLKQNGANQLKLKDIYCKHVRSVVEYGAVVWYSGLTSENTINMERVQKCAFSIIFGKDYQNDENALSTLHVDKLCIRREALCVQFAEKALKKDKFSSSWFVPDEKLQNTRQAPNILKPVQATTTRFAKYALPYTTNFINRKVRNMKPPSTYGHYTHGK